MPPSKNVSQATIMPQKKATEPMPLGCIFKEDFVRLFGFFPECEGKIHVKRGFYAPKAKIMLEKKATGPTPRRCICDKDLFFWSSSPSIFFCPTKIFYAPFSPAHYSGAGSASMNRSEVGLKIVFLEDHNVTSISTISLGLGEDLFLFCLEITTFPKLFAKS